MRRELRQFEYTCDGYTKDGKRCNTRQTITAYGVYQADQTVLTNVNRWTGFHWVECSQGWLCPKYTHRDDPRTRA